MTPSNEDLEQWEAVANEAMERWCVGCRDENEHARCSRQECPCPCDSDFWNGQPQNMLSLIAEVRRLRQHSQEVWHKFDKDDAETWPSYEMTGTHDYWLLFPSGVNRQLAIVPWSSYVDRNWERASHWMPITTPEPPKEES